MPVRSGEACSTEALVRDLTELVPECLRVTAGTPEEVDLFLSALEEVLT